MRDRGLTAEQLKAEFAELSSSDADWRSPRTWSLVYSAGDDHDEIIKWAYTAFFHENGLSPSAFPSLERMEREVVHNLTELVGADPSSSGGTMASGGTESIILALKAYRDAAGIDHSSIVLPSTAHPAFLKGAQLLGIEARVVAVDEDLRADTSAMEDAIDFSTIVLAGSAPAYPYGLVDPIMDLGEIAERHEIGLHVDACLGGITLPFLRRLGRQVPEFDFSVSGVTSMSVDLHKYGFAAKGASAVLYRDRDLRNHQFTVFTNWPGGALTSPTLLGTRPGGAIAAAWAAMNHLGTDGYLELFGLVMRTVDALRSGIGAIGDLEVIGDPPMSIFAVTSQERDVFALADSLENRGWRIDRQAGPDCIHHIVTPRHHSIVDIYLEDLASAYAEAPLTKSDDPVRTAFYGVNSQVEVSDNISASLVDDLARRYDRESGSGREESG